MSTTARVGVAVVGSAVVGNAVVGVSDMPDLSGDHFTWEGSCWEAVTDPNLGVAMMDPSASSVAKEALTVRQVQSMSTATKKLVVTEETLLNHATLIGQTVVDDINVQGKLIGTDGVFKGTVDFENVNVTGEILGNMISGEHIYGTVVEGGEIRTTDGIPGQVILSDAGYVDSSNGATRPGIRIIPQDTSGMSTPPGIGANSSGLSINGGRGTDGSRSHAAFDRGGIILQSSNSAGAVGEMKTLYGQAVMRSGTVSSTDTLLRASPADARLQATGTNGDYGWVRAQPGDAELAYVSSTNTYHSRIKADPVEAFLFTRAGGAERYLSVDKDGVWVKTRRSGAWEMWNLEETASDSGWISLPLNSAVTGAGSPAYRIKGGVVFFRGTLTLPGANWSSGWTTLAAVTNSAHKPSFDIQRAGASRATGGIVLQLDKAGSLQMYLPSSLPGTTTIQLSPMFYPIG